MGKLSHFSLVGQKPRALLALLLLYAGVAEGVTKYVIPGGTVGNDGDSWDSAYSNIQQAVDASAGAPSAVYLKSGAYTNFSQINIANHLGLTIEGGYLGDGGTSTNLDSALSVITRSASVTNRIFFCSFSTVTVARATVTGGLAPTGSGIYLSNCVATLTNCSISGNLNSFQLNGYGGGVYVYGGTAGIYACRIANNGNGYGYNQVGGGFAATNALLTVQNTTVASNSAWYNGATYGGGAYLSGGNVVLDNCTFLANFSKGVSTTTKAGGLYVTGVSQLVITNCVFTGNYANRDTGSQYGGVLYLTGAGTNLITDSYILKNTLILDSALEDLYLDHTGVLTIRNTVLGMGGNRGIYKQNTGTLILTNCLVHSLGSHGVEVYTGSVTIANSTLANNGGWGLTNTGGSVVMRDSIAWDNYAGGFTGGTLNATYTDAQEAHDGTGNLNQDPLFTAGFYLATNGLLFQTANSPCRNAGSASADDFGLTNLTTRTDGAGDQGTVDLGYHYPAGIPLATLSNLVLYVDVANGTNTNDGLGPASALKTITEGLARAIDGTTLNIATGTYNAGAGEVFPLSPQDVNLTWRGTNRESTVLMAGGVTGVVAASGMGQLKLEGLTCMSGLSPNGGGVYLMGCQGVLTNCEIRNNSNTWQAIGSGGGVYAYAGSLGIYNSRMTGNGNSYGYNYRGGGVYADSAAVTIRGSTIASNSAWYNGATYGGGIGLRGGSALLDNCTVLANFSKGVSTTTYGGGLYAINVSALTISNSTFSGNYANRITGSQYGGVMYITGSGAILVTDCSILNNSQVLNSALEDLFLDGTGLMAIRNTVWGRSGYRAIYKQNTGVLTVSNCLFYSQGSHGFQIYTGAVTVANSTLVNNGGWGLTNTGGTVTMRDCIAWGNGTGGLTGGTINVTYTDAQELHAGAGNLSQDPLFIAGFYLSTNGLLGQAANSPCLNAGSALAGDLDLSNRTTRTDGAGDQGQVDLGYHYTNGVPNSTMSNLVLYVDVVNGTNTNDGWTPATALKTITAALGRAIDGTTVNIGTGTYNTNAGEMFPLTPQNMNLTLRGTNRDATVITAGASTNILAASGLGILRLEALVFSNGMSPNGGAIYLMGCQAAISNCAIRCSSNNWQAAGVGGGIYAYGGSLGIQNCLIAGNGLGYGYNQFGGGLCADSVALTMRGTTISSNSAWYNGAVRGGGIYLSGGSALLDDCLILTNFGKGVSTTTYGGGLYAGGAVALTITNCTFNGNYVSKITGSQAGGVMYLASAGSTRILNSRVVGNTNSASAEDLSINTSAPVTMWNTRLGLGSAVGIRLNSGWLALTNCLVYAEPGHGIQVAGGTNSVGNTTIAGNGGWGVTNSTGSATLLNCIVWSNVLGGIYGCTAAYSDYPGAPGADGNIGADPRFEAAVTGNYHLVNGSPCVNFGSNETWMSAAGDMDGNPRIRSGTVDMGAYEELFTAGGAIFTWW